jgi:DNA-binding CsgD family transcriptional regulator
MCTANEDRVAAMADPGDGAMNVMTEIVAVAPALSAAVPSDIETLLTCLAGRLEDSSNQPVRLCKDPAADRRILLDVEVGDIRFVALRLERPSTASMLSPREHEIARMVAAGYPNKTIASILDISSWTVASHLRRIFIKLDVSSRAAMAARLSAQALNNLPPLHIDNAEQGYRAGISGEKNEKSNPAAHHA